MRNRGTDADPAAGISSVGNSGITAILQFATGAMPQDIPATRIIWPNQLPGAAPGGIVSVSSRARNARTPFSARPQVLNLPVEGKTGVKTRRKVHKGMKQAAVPAGWRGRAWPKRWARSRKWSLAARATCSCGTNLRLTV
jgi:hypothetical protein